MYTTVVPEKYIAYSTYPIRYHSASGPAGGVLAVFGSGASAVLIKLGALLVRLVRLAPVILCKWKWLPRLHFRS